MYLWDANILRYFGQGHATLRLHLLRVPWREIALPSVVVAEVLRGRCDFALKASPAQAPHAHERLRETMQMLLQFQIVVCDQACAEVMNRLRQRHRRRKRYADLMIAAMAIAGRHVVVTRNTADFIDVLSSDRIRSHPLKALMSYHFPLDFVPPSDGRYLHQNPLSQGELGS